MVADTPPQIAIVAIASQEAPAESGNLQAFRDFMDALTRIAVPIESSPVAASAYLLNEGGRASYDDFVRAVAGCTLTGFSQLYESSSSSSFVANLSCPKGKALKVTTEMNTLRIHTMYWGDRPTVFVPPAPPQPRTAPVGKN